MGRAEEGTAGGGGEGGVLREASAGGSHTLSHAHSLGDKQALGCAGTPADRCCLCEQPASIAPLLSQLLHCRNQLFSWGVTLVNIKILDLSSHFSFVLKDQINLLSCSDIHYYQLTHPLRCLFFKGNTHFFLIVLFCPIDSLLMYMACSPL